MQLVIRHQNLLFFLLLLVEKIACIRWNWLFLNLISEILTKLEIPNSDQVYFPSDDSFLFLDYIDTEEFSCNFKIKLNQLGSSQSNDNYTILDMGSGTGVLGFCLAYKLVELGILNRFQKVIIYYIDINPKAIALTRQFITSNKHFFSELKVEENLDNFLEIKYIISDLFKEITWKIKFDLCIFNPPYLPSDDLIDDENKLEIDFSWNGGDQSGNKTILNFFSVISNYTKYSSEIYFIASSQSDTKIMLEKIFQCNFSSIMLQSTHKFFEDIILFKSCKINNWNDSICGTK